MNGVVNIDDLRKLAKKRLPKIAYDFIEGGTDDEVGLVTNEQAFRQARIVPRYLVDVSVRDQSTTLFGRTYSSPIGIAPTGLAGLFRHGADLMLAEAARDANVPFIMSGSSTGSIEDLGKLAPDHGWYQLYSAKDQAVSEDMIKRAGDAGLRTLVFTVDVPEGSNRERNTRNGWGRPLKLTWKTKFEALMHPAWMMQWLKHGTPYFDNWAKYAGPDADGRQGGRPRRLPEPRADDLEACRALPRAVEGQLRAEGDHASRRRDPRPCRWASTASWCRTTARVSSTSRRRRSKCCRRSATRSATR